MRVLFCRPRSDLYGVGAEAEAMRGRLEVETGRVVRKVPAQLFEVEVNFLPQNVSSRT